MKSKRINLTPTVRFKVLSDSKFRCVYCGATAKESKLEVDHVVPVSLGGTNELSNLVAACFDCNRGKRDRLISSAYESEFAKVPDKAWESQASCPDLVSAWRCALESFWPTVVVDPPPVFTNFCSYTFQFSPSFLLRGRESCDIGGDVLVMVTPWEEVGCLVAEEAIRIRNAVIAGYQTPTMILMGPPEFFYGVAITERYKGCPHGFVVDGLLQPRCKWQLDGWYPDENLDFQDLRSVFKNRTKQLREIEWDFERECFVGVYATVFNKEE